MKRIFIGTFIDESIFKNNSDANNPDFKSYDSIIDDFKNVCCGKWVERENLHFTYKFLGDTEERLIPNIKLAMSEILCEHNFNVELTGLGVFPKPAKPNVLFAKLIDKDKKLKNLHNEIENTMKKFGFEAEERRFTPHLTLMRIKSSLQPDFQDILNKYKKMHFASLDLLKVYLIESKLYKTGPVYTIL